MGVMKRLAYEHMNGRATATRYAYPKPRRSCSISGCDDLPRGLAPFCPSHYRLIPRDLAYRINRAARDGEAAELRFAVDEAIALTDEKLGRERDERAAGQPLLF